MKRVEDIELGFRLAHHGHEIRYWRAAKSFMLRPITFADFCGRAENDGRALAEMKRIHPAPEMVEYCHGDATRRWAEVAGELDVIVAAVAALEQVVGPTPSADARPVLEALHGLYRQAFLGFAVKGVAAGDAAAAGTKGG